MKINLNLFKNNRKKKENHPDWQGNGRDADGNPYRIAAWEKQTRNGDMYLSCSVSPDMYATSGGTGGADTYSCSERGENLKGVNDLPF